jgi:sugar lactone lactonase YvrE
MTIDAEGGLWVALWRGSAVHRYLDGALDAVIELPVSLPTSCTFGGDDLDELFITSASDALTAGERAAQPLGGAVFRVRPGVHGLPAVHYRAA